MTNINELKKQMNQIIEDNKPNVVFNSPEDRLIRELELTLTELELKQEYKKTIAELDLEKAQNSFGGSGFNRSNYEIAWKKWEDKHFRLVLTNIQHNNSKLLLKTPDQFKKDTSELFANFLGKLKEDLFK